MIQYELLDRAVEVIRTACPAHRPAVGFICGSGWGDVVSIFEQQGELSYDKIPGLGRPGVEGHTGRLVFGERSGVHTLIFQGRRHFYEGEGWTPIALPIYAFKQLGVRIVILTNAAGGVRADLHPGDLMLITDHINNLGNPLIGPHNPIWGPRFPDQSNVYDLTLQQVCLRAAERVGIQLKKGVYLASTGPSYETPAEIRAYRTWGADAVGMSTVPEAILASAAGLRVLGISCITNYAAGIAKTPLTHEEVTATTQEVMPKMRRLFEALWEELAHV